MKNELNATHSVLFGESAWNISCHTNINGLKTIRIAHRNSNKRNENVYVLQKCLESRVIVCTYAKNLQFRNFHILTPIGWKYVSDICFPFQFDAWFFFFETFSSWLCTLFSTVGIYKGEAHIILFEHDKQRQNIKFNVQTSIKLVLLLNILLFTFICILYLLFLLRPIWVLNAITLFNLNYAVRWWWRRRQQHKFHAFTSEMCKVWVRGAIWIVRTHSVICFVATHAYIL